MCVSTFEFVFSSAIVLQRAIHILLRPSKPKKNDKSLLEHILSNVNVEQQLISSICQCKLPVKKFIDSILKELLHKHNIYSQKSMCNNLLKVKKEKINNVLNCMNLFGHICGSSIEMDSEREKVNERIRREFHSNGGGICLQLISYPKPLNFSLSKSDKSLRKILLRVV